MNSSNFFKLGATSFEGGNKATPRPQNTKSKSSPNLPTDKLSAADQLAAESQAVFDGPPCSSCGTGPTLTPPLFNSQTLSSPGREGARDAQEGAGAQAAP